VKRFTNE
ncbi:Cytoplasmic protein, partial [Monkeypox virus]